MLYNNLITYINVIFFIILEFNKMMYSANIKSIL